MALDSSGAVSGIDTVFLVDADHTIAEQIDGCLSSERVELHRFDSAEDFLSRFSANGVSCLVVEEQLSGMGGTELMKRLRTSGVDMPTIVVTDAADVPFTVQAMRGGACSVIEKPCRADVLCESIGDALSRDRLRRRRTAKIEAARQALAKLSESEREVLERVLNGVPNKQIAQELGVCVRTVEARRSRIYQTSGAASVAELVKLCYAAGIIDM